MKSLFLSTFCLFSALCVGAQTLAPFDRSHLATFGLNNPADTTLRYAPEVASTNTAIEQPLFPTLANMVPYRIPAIAVTPKGRLIAVSDYRPCGADIGFGRVDLRYRTTTAARGHPNMCWHKAMVCKAVASADMAMLPSWPTAKATK